MYKKIKNRNQGLIVRIAQINVNRFFIKKKSRKIDRVGKYC